MAIAFALVAAAAGISWLLLRGAGALTDPQPAPLSRFSGKPLEIHLGNPADGPLRLGDYRFEPGSGLFLRYDPAKGKLWVRGTGVIVDELSGRRFSPPPSDAPGDAEALRRFLQKAKMPECTMERLDPSAALGKLLSSEKRARDLLLSIETADPSDQSAFYADIGPEKDGSRPLRILQQNERYPGISAYNLPRGLYRFDCEITEPGPFLLSLEKLLDKLLRPMARP
jgi:hypothetical protein